MSFSDAPSSFLLTTLTYDILVHARDLELLRRLDGERDAGGRIDLDRVREPERELELLALQHGAVSGPADLEILREARGHPGDHVRDERARQPMQRAVLLAVVGARDGELPVLTGDRNVLVERARQF